MPGTPLRSANLQENVQNQLKSIPPALSIGMNRIDKVDMIGTKFPTEEDYTTFGDTNHMNVGKENLPMRRKGNLADNIKYCRFCQNNGEEEVVFLSHATKENNGTVICPILREYICPVCGQSGDKAHTVSYCPNIRRSKAGKENENPPIPTPMPGHLINVARNKRREAGTVDRLSI